MFVPDLVIALIPPPMKFVWRTSNGAITTCTSSIASIEIGLPPPGRLSERPKLLLKFAPSTVKFVEGERRAISEILRLMVGKEVICDEEILVVAPVFSVLNFVFAAVITISSKVSEDSFNLTFKL